MEGLHRLAINLRPTSLDRHGLVAALEQYAGAFREQYGLQVDLLAVDLDEERLPEELSTALYRIVQEGLTNVVRHAQATRASVVLERRDDRALLVIEDDGRGFDVDAAFQSGRLGLLGMRERAEMLGGSMTIESRPGHATALYVDVPMRDETSPAGSGAENRLAIGGPWSVEAGATGVTQTGARSRLGVSRITARELRAEAELEGLTRQLRLAAEEQRARAEEMAGLSSRLAQERDRLQALLNSIPDEVWFCDASGAFSAANPAAVDGLGFDKPDGNFRPLPEWRGLEIYAADGRLRPHDDAPLLRSLRGEVVSREVEMVRDPRTNELRHRQASSAPVHDDTGRIVGAVALVRDISHDRSVEQALRTSEERYRSLFNGMTEGFALHEIVCDENGRPCDYRFLAVNPAFERLTGLSGEAVVGRLRSEVLPNDYARWLDIFGKVALSGEPIRFQERSSALERDYEVYAYRPAARQFAALFMDVTASRQLHAALRQANFELSEREALLESQARQLHEAAERLEQRVLARTAELSQREALLAEANDQLRYQASLLDNVRDAVVATDQADKIRSWNRAAEEMFGRSASDVTGCAISEVIPARVLEATVEERERQLAARGFWSGELVLSACDGNPTYLETTVVLVRDASGQVSGQVGVMRDVTQHKRADEELKAGREQLKNLSRRLVEVQEDERRAIARELHDDAGQLLASLSIGLRVLERRYGGSPEALSHVGYLQQLVDEVQSNVHDLGATLRPASLDKLGLLPALRQSVERYERQYGLKATIAEVDVAGTRLPASVETAVYRIVEEALSNVLRHARASRVDVLLQRRADALIAIVEDDGAGFEVDELWTEHGLGLVGMRERAEMLGGKLTLESTPGFGTTVYLTMPC